MSEDATNYSATESVLLGALDLGSNSFHLLVAKETDNHFQVIDKHKEMVRLAAGITDDNTLNAQAQARALQCLERFGQRLRPLDPANVRVVGTNTMRRADSPEFMRQAEQILGHKINIISGREEARLIYLGVCHDIGVTDKRRLIVDIGGGSTEIVSGQHTSPDVLESLYMGCVSMTNRHFADGTISKKNFKHALDDALLELEPVASEFLLKGWDEAIGTSGTINAIRDIIAANYGATRIEAEHLNALKDALCGFRRIQDIDLPGLVEERKAVFPGGLAILSAVFNILGIESMDTSQSALREGLIVDLIGRHKAIDTRDETVSRLMTRFSVDAIQARGVRETGIGLLSQVASSWSLTTSACKHLLGWSADLMEIGMDVSHSGYHKHSGYLLEHMDMPGFSQTEQLQISILVRCHRRKIPTELFGENNIELKRLTTLLRLAAVLHRNRSHESLPHIAAEAKGDRLTIDLPKDWLAAHPLTALDLKNEKTYLRSLDIDLVLKTH